MQSVSRESVALLTADFRRVDSSPAGELVEQFYAELRRLASSRMKGERRDHLELLKVRELTPSNLLQQEDKAAFLGFAGHLMKRLLIHHARPLYRQMQRVPLEDEREPFGQSIEALQEVDDALSRLAAIDAKFRSVVEMRVFEGLTNDEIASKLDCSRRSVVSYWNFARRWLEKEWAENAT
jgi:RNA polymerase sigma factor (TIGR02999 family)